MTAMRCSLSSVEHSALKGVPTTPTTSRVKGRYTPESGLKILEGRTIIRERLFEVLFQMELYLGYVTLKAASKRRSRMIVRPSKIFVWGVCFRRSWANSIRHGQCVFVSPSCSGFTNYKASTVAERTIRKKKKRVKMTRLNRDTTKHSPRSPRPHHPSDGGAFQHDAYSTYRMCIARGYDPTSHQRRTLLQTRPARMVAGATSSSVQSPASSAVFTDTQRESIESSDSPTLDPKPMSYDHTIHYVQLQDISFSQLTVNQNMKRDLINQIKCDTSKLKLVFTLLPDDLSPQSSQFDVYIAGFFGQELERQPGSKAHSPQIPLIEVVYRKSLPRYISINNRRLYSIHTLLYALTRQTRDVAAKNHMQHNGKDIDWNIGHFKETMLKNYNIEVKNIYCPVLIHNETEEVPRYLIPSYTMMRGKKSDASVTWGNYLSARFKMQQGCCEPKEFKFRGSRDKNGDRRSCPGDERTITSCDLGILHVPTFNNTYQSRVYVNLDRETKLKKPIGQYTSTIISEYEEMIYSLTGVDLNELYGTDATVIFPEIPDHLKGSIIDFYETTKCLPQVGHRFATIDDEWMRRYSPSPSPAKAPNKIHREDEKVVDDWEELLEEQSVDYPKGQSDEPPRGGHIASYHLNRKSHRHTNCP